MQRISDDELAELAEHNGWPSVRDRLLGHTQEEATAYIVGQAPAYSDGEMRWFQDYLAFLHGPAVRQYRYYCERTSTVLYKATITIYSDFDPLKVELSALAREAENGAAICTTYTAVPVTPDALPEEAAEFFREGDFTC
jgi:hypothetical protein